MTRTTDPKVRLDLNSPEFQRQLFALDRDGQARILATLRKLHTMTWLEVYSDHGLRWERILSRPGPQGSPLYSFRVTRSFRCVACRDGDWLRLLTLHPDHDSAYG